MTFKTKRIALIAAGIALFVVLSVCLQVPVFENYYLCLGYVAMAVYSYSFGTLAGTLVGTFGVMLYCVLISGMRGLPGWALGNAVIGVALGWMFRLTRGMRSSFALTAVHCLTIAASTAVGILIVKSLTESVLYMQPMALRVAKNMSAFIADAVTLLLALPVCGMLDGPARKLFPEMAAR